MAWDEAAHPRAAAGTPQGGQFVAASSSSSSKSPAKSSSSKTSAKKKPKRRGSGETLAYDPKRRIGPGYGSKNGDPRVKQLQQQLNRLGLTDASGRRLKVDGKLGPLTTQAIKAAQRRFGMKADGRATPEFLARLKSAKPRTKTSRLRSKQRPGGRSKNTLSMQSARRG